MADIFRLNRGVVEISGPDAERLLHDTLTADIKNLAPGTGRWFGLLSPQGKVLAEGLVVRLGKTFWFDLPPSARDEFIRRLTLYRLRADVKIADRSNTHGVGWSKQTSDGDLNYTDGRHPSLGFRRIEPVERASGWATERGELDDLLATAGIVEMGTGFEGGANFAHDLGMDELGGIDFEKGCYIGQEIVSRMRHRGTARKRPVIVSANAPIAAGAVVKSGDKVVGTVFGPGGRNKTVGLLRIDKISAGAPVLAGDVQVLLGLPDWAGYRFSESEPDG
jgi:tRNA-modifying protein YgfZ